MFDVSDLSAERKALKTAQNIGSKLGKIYEARRRNKIEEFLNNLDLRYDAMTEEKRALFEKYVMSDTGQEILVDYIESILQTSCKRARMAIALLYCGDYEFNLNQVEIHSFVRAMTSINDDLLNFFLKAVEEPPVHSPGQPYPRGEINQENAAKLDWDEEAIFININELIGLRLLLPDPQTNPEQETRGAVWKLGFGITNTTKKLHSLLLKAEALLAQ